VFATQLGKNLIAYHVADVEREEGVWNLTQKLSDNTALKICVGLLILLTVMTILEVNIVDGGADQGLMQLDEIARDEAALGSNSTEYICEQIRVYTRLYIVLFVYINGKTYFDKGECLSRGIPLSELDPWVRIQEIIRESTYRNSEVVWSCWKDYVSCSKQNTVAMSLVSQAAENDDQTVASIQTIVIVIALLLVFVYALNTGITSFSKTLLQPLRALVDDMAAMSQLELVNIDREFPEKMGAKKIKVAEELQQLQESCTSMRGAIKSWSKYVPPAVVQRLFRAGVEAKIGVARVQVTILFCDIKGFEDRVRGLSPEDVLHLLSQALGRIADVIARYKGTLLEFIGDEVLAVFNAPSRVKFHTYSGVCSALEIHKEVSAMPPLACGGEGRKLPISCRVGVNTCNILAGNIGSAQRMKYGLLGDGINLTARLKGINSKYNTGTLVSDKVFADDKTRFQVIHRPVDLVAVKGKKEPTTVLQPLELKDLNSNEDNVSVNETIAETHTQAFDLYRERHFTEAAELFGAVNDHYAVQGTADEPSRILRARCLKYAQEPPADDWDGVERLTKK